MRLETVPRLEEEVDVTPAWGADAGDGLSRLNNGFKRALVGGRMSLLHALAGLSLLRSVPPIGDGSDSACS